MAPSPDRRLLACVLVLVACEGSPQIAAPTPVSRPTLAVAAAPDDARAAKRRARREEAKRGREAPAKAKGADQGAARSSASTKTPTTTALPGCPPGSPLTYRSFGAGFLRTWCTGCHSSTLPEAERQGAPEGIDLDRPAGLVDLKESILDRAVVEAARHAADPGGSASPMPPAGGVSDADRRRLEIWLACGLPGLPGG